MKLYDDNEIPVCRGLERPLYLSLIFTDLCALGPGAESTEDFNEP